MENQHKFCFHCQTTKLVSEFGVHQSRPDGLTVWCKECKRASDTARNHANPEANRAKVREWRRKNPEKNREQKRRDYWENVEERRAYFRAYASDRRAKIRAVFIEAIDPYVVYLEDLGVCGICGGDVDINYFDVDHIVPIARGGEHSYRNVQIAHPTCNKRKWCFTNEKPA